MHHAVLFRECYRALQLICEVVGTPTEEDLVFVTAPAARNYMLRQPYYPPVPVAQLFPHVRGPCLDLIDRMLKFNPAKRITLDVRVAAAAHACVCVLAALSFSCLAAMDSLVCRN